MIIEPIKTRIFRQGESLPEFIFSHIKKIPEKSIVVITSKVVSLAEGRVTDAKSDTEKTRLIKSESQWAMRTKYTWLTVKNNMVMARAGIDESNADGHVILLPDDAYVSARRMRGILQRRYRVKHIGVLITDSRLYPLRAGVVGVALGYAGFKGFRSYKGKRDLFGRILKYSRTNIADSLATAAILVMGEGDERQPLACVTDAPVKFTDRTDRHELDIDIREDMYQPFFERIKKIKW